MHTLLAALVTTATAAAVLPSPATNAIDCGWPSASDTSYVCDPDHILSNDEREKIQHLLKDLAMNLHDPRCGNKPFELGIALTSGANLRAYTSDRAVSVRSSCC